MYHNAKRHFKKTDPRLHTAALDIELEELVPSSDLFRDIVWTIVGQQLSARAADAIFMRLEELVEGKRVATETLLALSPEKMRTAGLSGAKANAIRAFANAVANAELNLDALPELSDEDVVRDLTRVKGIGPWTAEMILMFSLARPDVFSKGDLGLRKGIMLLYNLRKPPSDWRLRQLSSSWSPYRTYAARILWKLSDRRTKRVGRSKAAKS